MRLQSYPVSWNYTYPSRGPPKEMSHVPAFPVSIALLRSWILGPLCERGGKHEDALIWLEGLAEVAGTVSNGGRMRTYMQVGLHTFVRIQSQKMDVHVHQSVCLSDYLSGLSVCLSFYLSHHLSMHLSSNHFLQLTIGCLFTECQLVLKS